MNIYSGCYRCDQRNSIFILLKSAHFSFVQVGSDSRKNVSDDTRILFCTTGVLVESIIHGNQYNPLDRYTHIILDEVHERDKDMDFLMIAVYKYINPKIKIIMMSATIDTDKFAEYYEVPSGRAPVIELGFQRNFEVTKLFLDDIEPMVRQFLL